MRLVVLQAWLNKITLFLQEFSEFHSNPHTTIVMDSIYDFETGSSASILMQLSLFLTHPFLIQSKIWDIIPSIGSSIKGRITNTNAFNSSLGRP